MNAPFRKSNFLYEPFRKYYQRPMLEKPSARRLGRPRDPNADRRLLATALKLIEERGYAGFSIDEIARLTGISKATIYRRWKSAGELLLDALLQLGAEQIPPPRTGRLERDLSQYFQSVVDRLNGPVGEVLRSLSAEAQVKDEFRTAFRDRFIAGRRAPVREMLRDAQRRGELASGVDLELLLDFVFGAIWYRLLIGHAPLNRKLVQGVVALVLKHA
ncbi:TetR family transcriptional regulator [Opitutaceae bacterium EW11]|nr:TetR family transcriptional regulator [Opitutaceae bacterium EW11]